MTYVKIEDADSRFAQLVDQVTKGEEVVVTRGTTPIAKLVPMPSEAVGPRKGGFGSAKDKLIYMADDFNAPLDDFKDYM